MSPKDRAKLEAGVRELEAYAARALDMRDEFLRMDLPDDWRDVAIEALNFVADNAAALAFRQKRELG